MAHLLKIVVEVTLSAPLYVEKRVVVVCWLTRFHGNIFASINSSLLS